jgi:hypothetical protein
MREDLIAGGRNEVHFNFTVISDFIRKIVRSKYCACNGVFLQVSFNYSLRNFSESRHLRAND